MNFDNSQVNKNTLNGIYLMNPCTVELEKQIISPATPKSVESEVSNLPASPMENVSNGNSGTDETPVIESCGKIPKIQKSNGVRSVSSSTIGMPSVPQSPKNGQFHHSKKRKGIRVNNPKSPPTETIPIESKIELESTTIKVTSSPSVDPIQPSQSSSSSSSPSVCITTADSNSYHVSSPKSELLGPSLAQLAEKLEKTNALQILPIRPSVITKQEPNVSDFEFGSASPPKKMKTDDFSSIPSVTVSEVPFVSAKASNQRTGATGGYKCSERVTSPLGGSDKPKPGAAGAYKGFPSMNKGNGRNSTDLPQSYQNMKPAHQGSLSSASQSKYNCPDSMDKSKLSISTIETDSKGNNIFPVAWSSPSAFLPTRRIYGDPFISKIGTSQSTLTLPSMSNHNKPPLSRSNGISNLPHRHNDSVLDFSVKRQRIDAASSQPALNLNLKVNVNLDGECLDLSLHKTQSTSYNKHVYHTISDIPPPNSMNQLGLRLTSEVTLFPSHLHPKQSKRQAPQIQTKESNKRELNNPHVLYSTHQFPSPPQHVQSQTNYVPNVPSHQRHLPEHPKQIQGRERFYDGSSSSRTKLNSANVYNQSNHNPHVWRPIPTTTLPSVSSGITHTSSLTPRNVRDSTAFVHTSTNSRGNKSKSVRSNSPSHMEQQRLPLSGHLRGTPPKQSLNMSSSHENTQHHRDRLLDDRRERNGSLSFEQLASSFGNFMLPPPLASLSYPNADPAFYSPFASPFHQLPPSALMRLPPGAMETLQLANYMQQGLSPHMTNWQSPPAKESRSQK